MFPPTSDEGDPRTSWQKFEDLASKVFRTPKDAVDTSPVRKPKSKRA